VINAALVPSVYDSKGLGPALMVGFCFCLFSLACAVGLSYIDKKAENIEKKKREGQEAAGQAVQGEEEKFKWSDLLSFNISFWLLTGSCVLTYMSVFPYIQICSDLL
jgi:hypothetical protein